MPAPSFIFREYDIRGVADRDMPDDVARDIGRGLGTMLSSHGQAPRLAVGRDCRLSSPRLHAALIAGLTAQGVHVVDIGIGPTPLLYFAVHTLGTDGGVMITGSHNPAEDNGFKVMKGKASFFGKDIQDLRELMACAGYGPVRPGKVESVDVATPYVEHMRKAFSFPVRAAAARVSTAFSIRSSATTNSTRTLGSRSTVYSWPR